MRRVKASRDVKSARTLLCQGVFQQPEGPPFGGPSTQNEPDRTTPRPPEVQGEVSREPRDGGVVCGRGYLPYLPPGEVGNCGVNPSVKNQRFLTAPLTQGSQGAPAPEEEGVIHYRHCAALTPCTSGARALPRQGVTVQTAPAFGRRGWFVYFFFRFLICQAVRTARSVRARTITSTAPAI